VKLKRTSPCAAGEMYISPLFGKMLAYANSLKPRSIYILSAKYGLLDLKTVIEPYEQTLNKMLLSERTAWAQGVLAGLREQIDLDRDHIVFLAGLRYRELLLPHIRNYFVPMEGMSFGRQLKWLAEQNHV
jgi:hypothetical protein